MVAKLNCNSLEYIHGWMVILYGQAHCTGYFTGKVLWLLINLRKPQNYSTSNDLQCMVLANKHVQYQRTIEE